MICWNSWEISKIKYGGRLVLLIYFYVNKEGIEGV